MPTWLKYIFAGGAVLKILISSIPKALQDKKLTIDELASLLKEICSIFGWTLEIQIPDKFSDTYLNVAGDIGAYNPPVKPPTSTQEVKPDNEQEQIIEG